MILFLLDTGLHAFECHLNIVEVDIKTEKAIIKHGDEGGANGGKVRNVFISKNTLRLIDVT